MKRLRWLLPALAMLCGACSDNDMFGSRYGLQELALSPDGGWLAVRFTDHELRRPGFGFYDLTRRKFTPVPNPAPDRGFSDPSFSPDGKSVVAVSGNQLMLIARDSLKVTPLTEGGQGYKESPVFLPDGSGILYVETNPAHYVLLNLSDRQTRTMLDPAIGFATLSRPFFGGPDRIIFAASGPRIPDLILALEKFPDSRPKTDIHIYGMKFGELPELILNNLWVEGKKKSRWFTGPRDLQAAKDGKPIIFIDYAASRKGPDDNVDQELFAIEDGNLRQLTHLDSALTAAAISYDGRSAAFGCASGHGMNHDLCILDIASGKLNKVGLLSDIRSAN